MERLSKKCWISTGGYPVRNRTNVVPSCGWAEGDLLHQVSTNGRGATRLVRLTFRLWQSVSFSQVSPMSRRPLTLKAANSGGVAESQLRLHRGMCLMGGLKYSECRMYLEYCFTGSSKAYIDRTSSAHSELLSLSFCQYPLQAKEQPLNSADRHSFDIFFIHTKPIMTNSPPVQEYWLAGYELSRQIVLRQIQYFLGPSATVRPYSYQVILCKSDDPGPH